MSFSKQSPQTEYRHLRYPYFIHPTEGGSNVVDILEGKG